LFNKAVIIFQKRRWDDMGTRRSFIIKVVAGGLAGIPSILTGRRLSSAEVDRLADKVVKVEEVEYGHCDAYCGSAHCMGRPYHDCSGSYCCQAYCSGCHKPSNGSS
jgi:hypothetical protein